MLYLLRCLSTTGRLELVEMYEVPAPTDKAFSLLVWIFKNSYFAVSTLRAKVANHKHNIQKKNDTKKFIFLESYLDIYKCL